MINQFAFAPFVHYSLDLFRAQISFLQKLVLFVLLIFQRLSTLSHLTLLLVNPDLNLFLFLVVRSRGVFLSSEFVFIIRSVFSF
jgi:hypothetical protein